MTSTRSDRRFWIAGVLWLAAGGILAPKGPCLAAAPAIPEVLTFYVSPSGNDAWTGRAPVVRPNTQNGPWQTLEPLGRVLKSLPGEGPEVAVQVVFQVGRFEFPQSFKLQGPFPKVAKIELKAERPGTVLCSGGRLVTNWIRAEEYPGVSSMLPVESRKYVYVANLKDLGITDYGSAGGGGIELFYQDRRMRLARWPNEGFVKIADVLGEEPVDVRGTKGDKVGKFLYEGDRPARWIGEKDPWVHGYWFWDWSDQRHPIQSIDPARSLITVKPPYHHYGYRKGQWWYGFNLLSELDSPGEWYLDRELGLLYFWPPDNPQTATGLSAGEPTVSVLPGLLELSNVGNFSADGLVFAHTRGTAITLHNCNNCTIQNCELKLLGGWSIDVRGGEQCVVRNNHLHQLGEGGVSVVGGDRPSLSPSHHVVEGNHIHDYGQIQPMYRAGVSLGGVGQSVVHNHIHHAPHQAVGFSGNNHLIAWNEIHHVCLESNDAGAIYAGRDWTMRGTVITCNYFHHISGFEDRGCMGVYLDDMFCGTEITKNVFYKVTRAAFIGGGRDNLVENNIFIDCRPALHVDARAMGWAAYHVPTTMTERLKAMPYQSEPWRKAYPQLAHILEDEPAAPKGNVIRLNLCFGGTWDQVEPKARQYLTIEKNLILPLEAARDYFADPDREDWRLRKESPLQDRLPEFQIFPFEQIGTPQTAGKLGMRHTAPVSRWVSLVSETGTSESKGPERWEAAIAKFEETDRKSPPPQGAILFVGSSSIVRWDTSRSFPQWKTINRGFGGSQIHEVTYYIDRILVPYQPRVIVFYAGDNDIAAGASPEEVRRRFDEFVKAVRTRGVHAPIIFIAIKPSIRRWHLIDKIRTANQLIRSYCEGDPSQKLRFLDVEQAMLGGDGLPRPELFVQDGLHLSEEGYKVWNRLLQPVIESLLARHPESVR